MGANIASMRLLFIPIFIYTALHYTLAAIWRPKALVQALENSGPSGAESAAEIIWPQLFFLDPMPLKAPSSRADDLNVKQNLSKWLIAMMEHNDSASADVKSKMANAECTEGILSKLQLNICTVPQQPSGDLFSCLLFVLTYMEHLCKLGARRTSGEINLAEELKLINEKLTNDLFPVHEALNLRATLASAINAAWVEWIAAGSPGLLGVGSESSSDEAEEIQFLERVRGHRQQVEIDDWIVHAKNGTGAVTVMSTFGCPLGKESYFEVHILGSSCDGLRIGLLTDGFVSVNEATTHGLGDDECSIGASGLITWSNSRVQKCINGQVWGKKKSTMKIGVHCDLRFEDKVDPKIMFSTNGDTANLESCVVLHVPSEWVRSASDHDDEKSRIFPAVSLNKGRIKLVVKKEDFHHSFPPSAILLFQENEVQIQ